jgi:hypothetical protein
LASPREHGLTSPRALTSPPRSLRPRDDVDAHYELGAPLVR